MTGATGMAKTTPLQRSEARAALATAIAAVAEAAAEQAAAARPIARYGELARKAEIAAARMASLRAVDDEILADFLFNGEVGARPEASTDLRRAEVIAAAAERDARAAATALARAASLQAAADHRLRQAGVDRRLAALAVLREDMGRLAAEFRRRLAQALVIDGILEGLRRGLMAIGDSSVDKDIGDAARTLAAAIGETRVAVRDDIAVRGPDAKTVAGFVDRLCGDPDLTWEMPA